MMWADKLWTRFQQTGPRCIQVHVILRTLTCNEKFGIRNIDFVTETVRDKILKGKYVNLATLLIPEYTD